MRKIRDFREPLHCQHPEHNPPSMIVLEPGIYEHVCPGCGRKQMVIVPLKAMCVA